MGVENHISHNVHTKVRLLQALWLLFIVFHLLVLFKIISFEHMAGGMLTSQKQVPRHVSLAITVLLLFIFLTELYLRRRGNWLRWSILIIGVYFVFNTLGNLLSPSWVENFIFSPITALFSFVCLQLFFNRLEEKV